MQIFAVTDTGQVRRENQDIFHYEIKENGQAVFAVCDGMGGAQAGNVASSMASEVFVRHLSVHIRREMSNNYREAILKSAIDYANLETYRKSISSDAYWGMGTTLVGGFLSGTQLGLVNVGDSRCYLWSGGTLTQITHDHSLVEELVRQGKLSREQAREHPQKNLITRALGTEESVTPDLFLMELAAQDLLLLCSDGLTNMVSDADIAQTLQQTPPEQICETLTAMANANGGGDNITAMLIAV